MALDKSCKEPNQKTLEATTMAKKRSFKRTKRAKPIVNFVELLPSDMIAEVISKVASSSVTDFFNCKLSCKTLDRIGKEKYVIRQVGIEEFDISRLRSRHKNDAFAYSRLCADCGNPGALFQQGMRQYFSDMKLQEGIESLDRAANSGHKTAAYVLGLILLCCGSVDDEKHKGMKLINGLKACIGKGIVECRIRIRKFLSNLWLHNELVRGCKPISFPKEGQEGHDRCRRRCPWTADAYLLEDEDDALFCEACTCEFESKFFCWLLSR